MTILVINCHWNNRGDEAAIRAMIDELRKIYPEAKFILQRAIDEFESFPKLNNIHLLPAYPEYGKKFQFFAMMSILSKGKIVFSKSGKQFFKALEEADIVIHAPGGPSIGDLYLKQEIVKLERLMMVKNSKTPYVFFAPSMGPFENKWRNRYRKKILENASLICLRENISQNYVEMLMPSLKTVVTLDSAFQHDIDMLANGEIYSKYSELKEFVKDGSKVIGMTITSLEWHSKYSDDGKTADNIRMAFERFIHSLITKGYRILFIPQLFGEANDKEYMSSFAGKGCFVMGDEFDCYFQQYVISKLFAVVGMRYHSNIFSAKMGTPFISVSYEQKMQGFMKKSGLLDYCLPIDSLTAENLIEKFDFLVSSYTNYKAYLMEMKEKFKMDAYKTTELVVDILDSL